MKKQFLVVTVSAMCLTSAGVFGQSTAQDQLAHGTAFWDQRLTKSAIVALEAAARDRSTAAAAHEALGRIYTFKGWQQESVFPGWHDEPMYRAKAIAELKAALASDPNRTSAKEALKTAEDFAAAESVDPAPPRPEIKALDARIQATRSPDVPIATFERRWKLESARRPTPRRFSQPRRY